MTITQQEIDQLADSGELVPVGGFGAEAPPATGSKTVAFSVHTANAAAIELWCAADGIGVTEFMNRLLAAESNRRGHQWQKSAPKVIA